MTTIEIFLIGGLAVGLAVFGALYLRERQRRAHTLSTSPKRILFPFVGHALSRRALDAALRLARSDRATLVPVFLAEVPMHLPIDSPLTRQCAAGLPLLETIEQRAVAAGVPVDARIERGRTVRHGLREAIAHERYDRIVVAAASGRVEGFHGDDIAWLLDHAPGEVVVIRPDGDDRLSLRRREVLRRPPARELRSRAPRTPPPVAGPARSGSGRG
jgi:nucleotide-binding universal stress UspA family protein